MLAVVKTPHTEFRIKGYVSPLVLKALKEEYGEALKIKAETDKYGLINENVNQCN